MSALPQARPSVERSNTRKGPARQETTPILDKYGRDPESLPEKLRALTDYKKGTGYGPFFHAAVADLPRLSSGGVCYAFVLVVNSLTYGRPRGAKAPVNVWTLPISAADLAEYCRANVRDIQRQLSELEERGMIAVKQVKQGGTVRYSISLLYSSWQALEDYAVWKRRQVVAIDEGAEDETAEDDEALPISKEAIPIYKAPQRVRPGRASRVTQLKAGVRDVVIVNKPPEGGAAVDMICNGVIESGRLTIVTTFVLGESRAKGEEKGNAERHGCRDIPPNGGSGKKRSKGESPAGPAISSIFDPLLKSSDARAISGDATALRLACEALGPYSIDDLVAFLHGSRSPRIKRPFSSPMAVVRFIEEFAANQKSRAAAPDTSERDGLLNQLGLPAWDSIAGSMQGKHALQNLKVQVRRSIDDPDMTADLQAAAKRLLEVLS